jgi:hypothetical protein
MLFMAKRIKTAMITGTKDVKREKDVKTKKSVLSEGKNAGLIIQDFASSGFASYLISFPKYKRCVCCCNQYLVSPLTKNTKEMQDRHQ